MIHLKNAYAAPEFRFCFPGETGTVEFKSGISSGPLAEAAVALSNTDGGVIFVGVGDGGEIIGKALDQGASEKINQILLSTHELGRYELSEIVVQDRPVVAIIQQRRAEGFSQTSDGRILVRRGPRNQSLMGTELFAFITSRALQRFEQVASSLPISSADLEYLEELGSARGWDSKSPSLPDRLRERGLARENELTIAGALLLTSPGLSLKLKKCVVEVRRYPREGVNYDRRVVFDGPLHRQVLEASRWVSEELGSDLIVSGIYRFDLAKLPEVVVREAIANAVAHRSYEMDRSATVVELRDDRVIIRSPGALPEPVTIETMRAAQSARNPVILEMLRALSLAEDAGRGVDVMQDSMRDALLDAPEFQDDGSFVTVTLPLRGPITDRERGWISELEHARGLQPQERLLMIHAGRGEALTNAMARSLLGGVDAGESRRALQHLRDVGLLQQVGERSGARYLLADSLSAPAAYRMTQSQLSELIIQRAREKDIVNADVREITGLTAGSSSRLLARLVQDGLLVQSGIRRGASYSAV